MSLKLSIFGVATLALGYVLGTIAPWHRSAASADTSPVVARFEGGVVTADELRNWVEQQGPTWKERLRSPQGREELVRQLLQEKVLVEAARRKGYDAAPEVRMIADRAAVELFWKKELEDAAKQPVTDADLQSYFDQHVAELRRPERVRIAHIFMAAPESGPERDHKLQAAKALLKQLKADSAKDFYAFTTLARQKSEDPATRPLGGELPALARADLEKRVSPEVAEAAFATQGANVLLDRVVEEPRGFHLVKLLSREAAFEPSLATLKDTFRARLLAERRDQARKKLLEDVERSANVSVDAQALQRM